MKKYRVTVNGTAYEIELEEMTGAMPAAAPAAAPAPAPAAAAPAGGEQVTSPMPGTILDVKFAQGAAVKKGDVPLRRQNRLHQHLQGGCGGVRLPAVRHPVTHRRTLYGRYCKLFAKHGLLPVLPRG